MRSYGRLTGRGVAVLGACGLGWNRMGLSSSPQTNAFSRLPRGNSILESPILIYGLTMGSVVHLPDMGLRYLRTPILAPKVLLKRMSA